MEQEMFEPGNCPFCGKKIDVASGKDHDHDCFLAAIARGEKPSEGSWERRPIEDDLKNKILILIKAGNELANNDVSGHYNDWAKALDIVLALPTNIVKSE